MSPHYPLSAIVGQDSLIEALLIIAVAPDVGGVLVRGERGTAKSTAARALAPLLPPVGAAQGQPYAFAPGDLAPSGRLTNDAPAETRPATIVELPIGATLDRLIGTLHLGRALSGEYEFEPGMLARAHQGILYVDEVNLLPDHLVDALLDAAASGVVHVEREAVSCAHDARFLLIGTMNVEEGELRPQLLDRFGLGVEVRGPQDVALRAEIVRRRQAFQRDPDAFVARWAPDEERLRERIATARQRLDSVVLPERELLRIAGACARMGIDGVRGDIVSARAAQTLAALDGSDEVREDHVRRAAALALAHRGRHDPLGGTHGQGQSLEQALDDDPPEDDPSPNGGPNGRSDGPADEREGARPARGAPPQQPASAAPAAERQVVGEDATDPAALARERHAPPVSASLPLGSLTSIGRGSGPAGRRARASGRHSGAIDSRPASPGSDDLAILATLRARLLDGSPDHLREHIRQGREAALLCLVVDASGSMGARRRLARVKGALLQLLRDAYARRDRVGVIAFRDARAHILVRPGSPLERAAEAILELPAGGRTPLAEGLAEAHRMIYQEHQRGEPRRTITIVLTDGRTTDPLSEVVRAALRLGHTTDSLHVIDTEEGRVRVGFTAEIARAGSGQTHRLAAQERAA